MHVCRFVKETKAKRATGLIHRKAVIQKEIFMKTFWNEQKPQTVQKFKYRLTQLSFDRTSDWCSKTEGDEIERDDESDEEPGMKLTLDEQKIAQAAEHDDMDEAAAEAKEDEAKDEKNSHGSLSWPVCKAVCETMWFTAFQNKRNRIVLKFHTELVKKLEKNILETEGGDTKGDVAPASPTKNLFNPVELAEIEFERHERLEVIAENTFDQWDQDAGKSKLSVGKSFRNISQDIDQDEDYKGDNIITMEELRAGLQKLGHSAADTHFRDGSARCTVLVEGLTNTDGVTDLVEEDSLLNFFDFYGTVVVVTLSTHGEDRSTRWSKTLKDPSKRESVWALVTYAATEGAEKAESATDEELAERRGGVQGLTVKWIDKKGQKSRDKIFEKHNERVKKNNENTLNLVQRLMDPDQSGLVDRDEFVEFVTFSEEQMTARIRGLLAREHDMVMDALIDEKTDEGKELQAKIKEMKKFDW